MPDGSACRFIRPAFGKITAVYGHIDENGPFVRKRPAPKMEITDKMVKNSRLSVKIQTFGPGFTDKSAKIDALSVNLHDILTRLVEQHCI